MEKPLKNAPTLLLTGGFKVLFGASTFDYFKYQYQENFSLFTIFKEG
jgi:hypothetical protein